MSTVVRPRSRTMASLPGGRTPVLPPRPHWQDLAECRESWDPVFFDPVNEAAQAALAAGKYCNLCPVRVPCLATALATKSPGVWAGTTLAQRTAMARVRTRAKCPVCSCSTLIRIEDHDACLACGRSWRTERGRGGQQPDGDDDR